MRRCHPFAVVLLTLLFVPNTAPAQTNRERPSVRAVRVDQPPRIDGTLDEAVWRNAPVLETFMQQEPREGEPASDRTEVRVLYDSGHLYIGVHAFASDPVVATEMRRDAGMCPESCGKRKMA